MIFMLMSIYSVYDSGISTWFPPCFVRNKGEILRWWSETANDSQSKISKHPQDYALFELGTWDDEKCKFDFHKAPLSMGLAIEFVKKEMQDVQEPIRETKKDTK